MPKLSVLYSKVPVIRSFLFDAKHRLDLKLNTLSAYRGDLEDLQDFLVHRGQNVERLTLEQIAEYLNAEEAAGISIATRRRRVAVLRLFMQFRHATEPGLKDLLARIKRPKAETRPPTALSREQLKQLVELPEPTSSIGARDAAILWLGSHGCRPSELCRINLCECNLTEGYVRIGNDRIIPLGKEGTAMLTRYVREFRQKLDKHHSDVLFLSRTGKELDRVAIYLIVRKYGAQIGVGDIACPRSLRASAITQKIRDGVHERDIQMMFGHGDIESTRRYRATPEPNGHSDLFTDPSAEASVQSKARQS